MPNDYVSQWNPRPQTLTPTQLEVQTVWTSIFSDWMNVALFDGIFVAETTPPVLTADYLALLAALAEWSATLTTIHEELL
jgi:hypothetical protein